MDRYNNTLGVFLKQFNRIFNKIPHIYSEIFLKLFGNRYRYFSVFNNDNYSFGFINVLMSIFCNIDKLYDLDFFDECIRRDFSKFFDDKIDDELREKMVSILSSDIEIRILLDVMNNNVDSNNYYDDLDMDSCSDDLKKLVLEIMDSYLVSKVLVRGVKILNFYNSKKGTDFYDRVNNGVSMFRTWEMAMDHVGDIYGDEYRDIISESEFKILIYLISLARNGEDISKKIDYDIDKLFVSMGYGTSVRKIMDYNRGYDYLEANRGNDYVIDLVGYREYPVIYENVSEMLKILFSKYYDDYGFIINKDRILRKIFYLYIKNVDLMDKIFLCSNYKLWGYEWDSIKSDCELNIVSNE